MTRGDYVRQSVIDILSDLILRAFRAMHYISTRAYQRDRPGE